jgi:hypothetical protein
VLRAVDAFRDLGELGGGIGTESGILLRHAFHDVRFWMTLIQQLARSPADRDGVRTGDDYAETHSLILADTAAVIQSGAKALSHNQFRSLRCAVIVCRADRCVFLAEYSLVYLG